MPSVLHLTASDMSLPLLLGPQLEAFRAAGYEVLTASAPGPFVAQLTERGLPHWPLPHATRSVTPWSDARAVAELRRALRTLRPDILHTHNPKPGVYGRVLGRLSRVPAVVNTVHGLYAAPEDPWWRRLAVYGLERAAAACSDAELVQNPEDLATLRRLRVPSERLHLLGNGIDLARFDPHSEAVREPARLRAELGIGADEIVVGAVGRLVREKGYAELFAAHAELRTHVPALRLVVTGPTEPGKDDGLDQAQLQAATDAGVVFLGHRDDVERIYPMMDIFVLPSHREGFPRAAMEASAMGIAVIATDVRGCRQVVDDGRTGLLVTPRDASALARAIETLADDPDRRRRLGEGAREKAQREFDDRRVIDITLRVYEQVLAHRPRAAAA